MHRLVHWLSREPCAAHTVSVPTSDRSPFGALFGPAMSITSFLLTEGRCYGGRASLMVFGS